MPEEPSISAQAQNLKDYRELHKLTQPELATRLNAALNRRYDRNRVSRWESDAERIPQPVIKWVHDQRSAQSSAPLGITPPHGDGSKPAIVMAVVNQKGGVGKTTSTVNIAYLLAMAGQRVLVVDSDAQANATIHFGLDPYKHELAAQTLTQVLFRGTEVTDAITPVCDDLLDLLPASISLSGADAEIYKEPNGTLLLREKLGAVRNSYDFILIDCAPNLGQLTVSALNASDFILIPSQTEMLSVMGIPMLLENLDKVRRRVNPHIRVLGILPTLHKARRVQDKEMANQLSEMAHGLRLRLFEPVREAAEYSRSVMAGRPTLALNPNASGAAAYQEVVDAMLEARNSEEPAHAAA